MNHEALKIDGATFEAGTYPVGVYDDGTERQIMGNCCVCDSTISVCGPSIHKGVIRYPRVQGIRVGWEELLPHNRYQGAIRFWEERCRCPMLVGGGIDHAPGCSRK